MDSVRNQREAKGVIMKTKSTKVEVTTKLYRKLHGEEPHGKAPSSWGERLWWFCPAWQIERKVLILEKAGIRGTFTEAKAEARKFFAARGTKRVALVPPYWDVVNRGKGNELLFLSPEDYVARKARPQAKRK